MVPTVPANVKAKVTLLESAEMAQSVKGACFHAPKLKWWKEQTDCCYFSSDICMCAISWILFHAK